MTIADAPPDVAIFLDAYLASGRHWRQATMLEESLWPHRGKMLLSGEHIVWLVKGDRRDTIAVVPRWCELDGARHSERHSCLVTQGGL